MILGKAKYKNFELSYRPETNDFKMITESFLEPVYDFKGLKDVKVIIDLGMHIGSFSLAARKAFPKALIEGYEALKENFDIAVLNCEKHDIKLFNKIVYQKFKPERLLKEMPLVNGRINTGGSFYIYGEQTELENIISWKEIEEKFDFIDILKMDVEGAELFIVPFIDFKKIGCLMIEFHQKMCDTVLCSKEYIAMLDEWILLNGFKSVYEKSYVDGLFLKQYRRIDKNESNNS